MCMDTYHPPWIRIDGRVPCYRDLLEVYLVQHPDGGCLSWSCPARRTACAAPGVWPMGGWCWSACG
ncbi:MAG: hypothetical protein H6596_08775 [Flavobacteriales bacterium]|nr:hypothetical protein [Flavobacteriales bacterium]